MEREEGTGELNDQEVDSDNNYPDDEEHRVVEEALAEVNLIMDLPGGNHVDNLEPDEEVKDEGHVSGRVIIVSILHDLVKRITIQLVKSTREDHLVILDVHVDNGVVLVEAELLVGLGDHVLTTEEEDEEDDHLEEGHVEDVLGHLAGHYEVILDLGWAQQELRLGELGGEGKRGQGVHDHVHPEKLNGLQR